MGDHTLPVGGMLAFALAGSDWPTGHLLWSDYPTENEPLLALGLQLHRNSISPRPE